MKKLLAIFFLLIPTLVSAEITSYPDSTIIKDNNGTLADVVTNTDKTTNIDGLNGVLTNAMMFGRVNDSTVKNARLDALTESLVCISFEHHEVHDGDSFERHIDSGNANVASLNVAFKTVDTGKLVHMLFGFGTDDEVLWEIIEGAIWTQGTGTALDINHHNRKASSPSVAILEDVNQATFTASNQFIQDVTGIQGGTIFENQYIYNASIGQNRSAEARTSGHEWVLRPDTTYVVRVTQTDGNCKMSINLHYYESTPRN